MRHRWHRLAWILFAIALLYDAIVWGAVPALPDVGEAIAESARREAPLAATYIALGRPLDAALPPLRGFGARRLAAAFGDGFARMREDRTVAMDLILGPSWNGEHRWLKTVYWTPPVLLALGFLLWLRRPREVRLIGRR